MRDFKHSTSKGLRNSLGLFAGLVAILASTSASAVRFNSGALIIPTQASFQDPCAMVSAYGLVYKLLQADDTLAAQGKQRITIHWAYAAKNSPNRCVPTNLSPTPQTPGSCPFPYTPDVCTNPPYLDTNWNDGCDFSVNNTLGAPVTLLDNSSVAGSGLAPAKTCGSSTGLVGGTFCSRDTKTASKDSNLSYPNYAAVTIQHTAVKTTNVFTVKYLGGAFIIDAPDVPQTIALLSGATVLNDFFGNPIDFSAFRKTSDIGTCGYTFSGGASVFTGTAPNGQAAANEHYVFIHQAQAGFDATDAQRMNTTPSKIALLQTAGGNLTAANGVKGEMLPAYLASAGLDFTGAAGCPPTGLNASVYTGNCISGAPTRHGYIFDAFDVVDLQDLSKLSETFTDVNGNTKFVYQNLWVPHWQGINFNYSNGSTGVTCDNNCINNTRATIVAFTKSRTTGLLAECGSIGTIEGTQGPVPYDPNGCPGANNTPSDSCWYPAQQKGVAFNPDGGYGDPDGGYPNALNDAGPPVGIPSQRLMTCVAAQADGGGCSGNFDPVYSLRGTLSNIDPTPPYYIPSQGKYSNNVNGALHQDNSIIGVKLLRNCTDPDMVNGQSCIYYEIPSDPYSQIGDYRWFSRSGLLANYLPNVGNTYNANVNPLAFTIAAVTGSGSSLTFPAARAQAMADNFTYALQPGPDGTKATGAQIIYLGGHTYSADVSGTRVVLNTMLALGAVPTTSETGLAAATAYNDNAFVPTYERVTTQGAPISWYTYSPNTADQFEYPYHKGHLRAHPIYGTGALQSGVLNAYNGQTAFSGADAAVQIPAPGLRNVFTYLGGVVTTNPSLGAGVHAPNNVLQTGWMAVDVDYNSVDKTQGCLDAHRIGRVDTSLKPTYTGPAYAGLIPYAGGDGVCDLQEALELTKINLGADNGDQEGLPGSGTVSGPGTIPNALKADLINAQEFTQIVRGYCYATDASGNFIPHPTSAQCNAVAHGFQNIQTNVSKLGGFVHSQAAIIPASTFVLDDPSGGHRPTVAYVGGLDGELHAFYVPSDTLDTNYKGTAASLDNFNDDASSTFVGHTTYGSSFTPPPALTELWAFVPPGQLPLMQANLAQVDSSPAVLDVYGDFEGTGIRSWHTVLVASAGGSNREVFAMDISNPLKPTLLWDIQSNYDNTKSILQYAPSWLEDDDAGLNTQTQAQAFAWQNGCHAGAANCTPSNFLLPPMGTRCPTQPPPPAAQLPLPAGCFNTNGLYNYSSLGASSSVSAAALRRNNQPVFAAYIATNEPDNLADSGAGVYVFAIDMVTGQKIWQFNNAYDLSNDPAGQISGIGNAAPAGTTLLSKAGNNLVDTVYVGDDEGALWELDAADGLNNTAYGLTLGLSGCTGPNCNFALSQAFGDGTHGPQPISTLSTVFSIPVSYPSTGPLSAYKGQTLLAYGTAGTDKVAGIEPAPDATGNPCPTGSIPPCTSGAIHILPVGPPGRYNPAQILGPPSLVTTAELNGVAKEVSGYPLYLTGAERVYGSVVALNDQLFFSTVIGAVTSIDSRGKLTGNSYQLNTEVNQATGLINMNTFYNLGNGVGAGQGTPLIDGKTGVAVVITDKGILRFDPPTAPPPPPPTQTNATNLQGWFFRRRALEY